MWKWKARKLRSEVCLVAGTLKVQRKCYVSFRNIKTCLDGAFLLCIVCFVESHEYLSCAWQTCASTFQSVVSILSFFSHCYKIPPGVPNTTCSGDASLFILALPLITVNFWVYIKKFYFGYIWFWNGSVKIVEIMYFFYKMIYIHFRFYFWWHLI